MYSVGQLTPLTANNTGIPYWYVRKSSDNGLNWSTVDLYQYAAGQWVNPTGFAADDLGHIYVAGWGREAPKKKNEWSGPLHWLVRKSADGGQTWTLADDLPGPAASFGAGGAGFVPGVGLFVVGDEFATGSSSWRVRRSVNGEPGTWATVDGPIARGAAAGVGSDSQGNIYVVGTMFVTLTAKPLTGYDAWVTCKSSDGGNTWSTVDSFTFAQNKGADANGIGRNSAGNVVVVGRASDAQGKSHWLVRTPDSSGVWQTVDDFQLAPGYWASDSGVNTDAAGNLLVAGAASDTAGGHWIVRRLAAPIP